MPRFEGPVRISNGYLEFVGPARAPAAAPTGIGILYFDPTTSKFYSQKPGAAAVEVTDLNQITTQIAAAQAAQVVGSANLDPTILQYATVNVSSAEILALFTTPKQLVAAPVAGQIIELVSLILSYVFESTPYTINGSTNLVVKYTNGSGAAASNNRATTGFIDQGANVYEIVRPLSTDVVPVVAAALVLTCGVANPTVGDGALVARVVYRVHSVP